METNMAEAKDKHLRRQQVYGAIRALIERDGDYCSLCHRAFDDVDVTYGGITACGDVAVTGACCASKITVRYTVGIYTASPLRGAQRARCH